MIIRNIVTGKSSHFLLVTTALSTLSLLYQAGPLLPILWAVFLLLGIAGTFLEGSVEGRWNRSIAFTLLAAGLLFVAGNRWKSTGAVEDWSTLYPEIVQGLREEINDQMNEHFEGRIQLVRGLGSEIRELYRSKADIVHSTIELFELLDRRRIEQPDSDDFLLVLTGLDGMDIAWSGDSYFPGEIGSSIDLPPDSLVVELFRGNIYTAAVIHFRLPGVGLLTLYDHMEIRHYLSKRYAGSGRFIDRLSRNVGTEVSLYPVNYKVFLEGRPESLLFPFVFQGEHLGNWSVAPVERESYIAKLGSLEHSLLPLFLFFPWLISFLVLTRWLKDLFLRGDSPSWRSRLCYIVLFGSTLFLLRIALIVSSFPSSWIGGAIFSPRFFATGLLEAGSASIGEIFISGLFISLFLIHVFPLVSAGTDLAGRVNKGKVVWISCGLAAGLSLSLSSPYVLERLFRDSLFSMVIDQSFIGSAVTVFWELSIFLLLFSLFLVVALCLRPVISWRGKGSRQRRIYAFISVILFITGIYLAIYSYGDRSRSAIAVGESGIIFFGGAWLSSLLLRKEEERSSLRTGWLSPSIIILLSFLSACVIYPGLLRYRHLALEETGNDLIEEIEAPIDNWTNFVLEEVAGKLRDRKAEIFSEEREQRGLGFYAWTNSGLSTLGQRTSLVIYDGMAQEISRFSLTDVESDTVLSAIFLEAQKKDSSFIYHDFIKGEEFYFVVVPYWDEGRLKNFLTVALPTDLEDRIGGGPIKLFTDDTEDVQLNVPDPMELRIYPAEEGERGDNGVWISSQDNGRRFRYYRKQVQIGGIEKIVEVRFSLQGILESLSLANFLFVFHILLLLVLWGVSSSGYRRVPFRDIFFIKTFQGKLRVSLITFAVIPTLLFGFLSGREIRKRIDQETRSRAKDGLDAMIYLVKKEMEQNRGPGGSGDVQFYSTEDGIFARQTRQEGALVESDTDLLLDNHYVKEIAGITGRDFLLFRDNRLESTSQDDLARAGMVPHLLGNQPFIDLVLYGKEYSFHRQSLGNYQYLVASRRLSTVGAERSIILATPLLWRQEEIDQEVADLIYLILMVIIVILYLSSWTGLVVGTHLSRPISQLMNAFESVGSGHFRADLERGRQDEFGLLFSSFDLMSQQLETSQKKLSEEKARIDGVLQAVGAGILAFGRDGTLKVVNARAVSLIGDYLEDQVGKAHEELTFEEEGWMDLIRGVQEVLQSGEKNIQREFIVTRGEELLTVRMTTNLLVDERGSKQGAVVAFEDISDTIRSQKIMAWGEMARQVAHEIKNPLTPIRLSIQHLHKTYQDGAPEFPRIMDGEVRVILREIDRLQRIAGDFSRYSKPAVEEVSRIDVSSVIKEVMELYGKEHGDISYSFVEPESEIWALASEEGLKKVLVNLIENGRGAISGKGELSVEVDTEEVQGVLMVKVTISDTGRGIPKADMGKLFDPNFSTRSGGTGLGLAITKRIIEEWGGGIKIWSREGEGTRVEVRIKGHDG